MASLARVRIALGGWDGAPGVNTLHFSPGTSDWDVQDDVDELYGDLDTLVGAFYNSLVAGVTAVVESDLTIFDSETGFVTGIKNPTDAPTVYTSTSDPSKTSRATQALIRFKTGEYVDGKQIAGRMFLGPLSAVDLTTGGLMTSAAIAAYPDWFSGITSGIGARLCIWRRPTGGAGAPGIYADVTQVSVRQKPSFLSSRLY